MDVKETWDRSSRSYDWLTFGQDIRQGDDKRRLFVKAHGRTILVAVGTGCDIKFLPPGLDIVAIDISPAMVEKARPRAEAYDGQIELRVMDALQLEYADASFDTGITACTFCSVPDPVRGLRELYRVLKPGSRLLMYEHVRSKVPAVGVFLDFMTYLSRPLLGPALNRDTVSNACRAGFDIVSERNAYFDIVKEVEAVKGAKGYS